MVFKFFFIVYLYNFSKSGSRLKRHFLPGGSGIISPVLWLRPNLSFRDFALKEPRPDKEIISPLCKDV
jgi:hypothetical protein